MESRACYEDKGGHQVRLRASEKTQLIENQRKALDSTGRVVLTGSVCQICKKTNCTKQITKKARG